MQYNIGSDHWPGTSKLVEECGEVMQVLGKLLGRGGVEAPWTDKGRDSLEPRLIEELGDLTAAILFFAEQNKLDITAIAGRSSDKLHTYREWHRADGH